jgi:hypothetical protein
LFDSAEMSQVKSYRVNQEAFDAEIEKYNNYSRIVENTNNDLLFKRSAVYNIGYYVLLLLQMHATNTKSLLEKYFPQMFTSKVGSRAVSKPMRLGNNKEEDKVANDSNIEDLMTSTKEAMTKLELEWEASAYNYFNMLTHILSQCNALLANGEKHATAIGMCLAPPPFGLIIEGDKYYMGNLFKNILQENYGAYSSASRGMNPINMDLHTAFQQRRYYTNVVTEMNDVTKTFFGHCNEPESYGIGGTFFTRHFLQTNVQKITNCRTYTPNNVVANIVLNITKSKTNKSNKKPGVGAQQLHQDEIVTEVSNFFKSNFSTDTGLIDPFTLQIFPSSHTLKTNDEKLMQLVLQEPKLVVIIPFVTLFFGGIHGGGVSVKGTEEKHVPRIHCHMRMKTGAFLSGEQKVFIKLDGNIKNSYESTDQLCTVADVFNEINNKKQAGTVNRRSFRKRKQPASANTTTTEEEWKNFVTSDLQPKVNALICSARSYRPNASKKQVMQDLQKQIAAAIDNSEAWP